MPKNRRRTEMVHLEEARREALQRETIKGEWKIRTLLNVAKIRRSEVLATEPWSFGGSSENFRVPQLVEFFTCWLVAGRGDANTRAKERANVVGQVIMTNTLTKRQANNLAKRREPVRESPLLVAAGLSVHQHTRSRNMVELLHGMGLSISYSKSFVWRLHWHTSFTTLH